MEFYQAKVDRKELHLLLVVNIKEIIVIYIVVIWLNIDRAGARLLSQIGSISSGLEGSRFGH